MALEETADFQFSERAGESTLDWREQVLNEKLALNVFNLQLRLSDGFSVDRNVSFIENKNLTLGDVVTKGFISSDSPELPSGFVRSSDRESNLMLRESHIDMLLAYIRSRRPIDVAPQSLAEYPARSLQDSMGRGISPAGYARWQHPKVRGYTWFRGNRIDVDKDRAAIIFSPWVAIGVEGGSPFPLAYTKGELRPDELARITHSYSRYLSGQYNRYLLEVVKKFNTGDLVSEVQGDIF